MINNKLKSRYKIIKKNIISNKVKKKKKKINKKPN